MNKTILKLPIYNCPAQGYNNHQQMMLLQSLFNVKTEYESLCGRVQVPTDGIVHDPRKRLIW